MDEFSDDVSKNETITLEAATGAAEELRRSVARLQTQLQQIRSALLGATAWVFGLTLVAAVFVPIIKFRPDRDKDPESYSVLRVMGAGFGAKTDSGGTDPGGLFLGVSYLVLLLVVLFSFYQLRVIGGRKATRSTVTAATAVVLLLGTAGAWATALLDVQLSWWQLEPGIVLLTIGAVGFAVLAFWSRARSWWIVTDTDAPVRTTIRDLPG